MGGIAHLHVEARFNSGKFTAASYKIKMWTAKVTEHNSFDHKVPNEVNIASAIAKNRVNQTSWLASNF